MRTWGRLLMVCACSVLLGGCWDRTEINDLAIITAAAIDKAEAGEIMLSIQVFIPRAVGGGGVGGPTGSADRDLTTVLSGKGVNLADAMSKVQAKLPRKVFWGHCKIYLFGEEAAKEGIADHIDFLVRHPEPRNRAYLYISRGTAAQILGIESLLERSTAETLREYASLHIGMAVTLVDFRNMLNGEAQAVALPYIQQGSELEEQKQIQENSLLMGTAIFQRDKMIGTLTTKATRGLLWLRNEMTRASVSVRIAQGQGMVSVVPIRATTKLIPTIANGKWSILVRIDTEGDIVENGTLLNMMEPESIALVEKAVENEIRARIELALFSLQKELHADVSNFAAAFHRKYPQKWDAVKANWDSLYPQVQVSTKIHVAVRRPGLISESAGHPTSPDPKE
ncbi:Ger(x)C family spore germination protein [Brevibacillus sp. SAFN-007a]|uniref:Ger(x)C family spore germination protein n=1 Tax=Brevibacillus sp. SAFN-007a TaxID=3436862 RepID=UPI003F8157D8